MRRLGGTDYYNKLQSTPARSGELAAVQRRTSMLVCRGKSYSQPSSTPVGAYYNRADGCMQPWHECGGCMLGWSVSNCVCEWRSWMATRTCGNAVSPLSEWCRGGPTRGTLWDRGVGCSGSGCGDCCAAGSAPEHCICVGLLDVLILLLCTCRR